MTTTDPFERVQVPGEQALATWEQLKAAGRGFPVVIGDDDSVGLLLADFSQTWPNKKSISEVLAAAGAIRHPDGLKALKAEERARDRENLRRQQLARQSDASLPRMIVIDSRGREKTVRGDVAEIRERQPRLGRWPSKPRSLSAPSVALDYRGPKKSVYVALIQTDDWTTIPAHLHYGGRNASPQPEYHVAALRSWRDRYGAELVGLSSDRMDLRVARRPQTRVEAVDLAREHYIYCNDIVDQDLGTLRKLAACLMANDWWGFWWD
jgi:hypothetical protein